MIHNRFNILSCESCWRSSWQQKEERRKWGLRRLAGRLWNQGRHGEWQWLSSSWSSASSLFAGFLANGSLRFQLEVFVLFVCTGFVINSVIFLQLSLLLFQLSSSLIKRNHQDRLWSVWDSMISLCYGAPLYRSTTLFEGFTQPENTVLWYHSNHYDMINAAQGNSHNKQTNATLKQTMQLKFPRNVTI